MHHESAFDNTAAWNALPATGTRPCAGRAGGRSSQRTTLAHWLMSSGRSRWLCTHLEKKLLITVSLVGRTTKRLLELLAAAVGDHGQLGAEALDMLGLEPQERLGDEEWEVGVLGAGVLDAVIERGLHQLPDA